ncbi:hypothetical protein [Verrucomicrobium sp. BvORR034]|uniref:hypothetical protein n=1 Tax=Verrucomicrobium sp. BvORR034 TaxID=1396418 RepID=UPI002240F158|nr:hypothetical protein [Verrucomicrobium sp. BvORR034]
MNQFRALFMVMLVAVAGMGAWVWQTKEKLWLAQDSLQQAEAIKMSELKAQADRHRVELAARSKEHDEAILAINADWEGRLDNLRKEERQRMSGAFEQFGDILDGSKKTLDYINALEQKVKAGQEISKAENQRLAVIATGLGYLQKQYQKPFQEFTELEAYLSKRASASVETPDMKNAFWKRMFSREFREQEREFYRTEGERRGFQEASAKFNSAYKAAQKQMGAVDLNFTKALHDLNTAVKEQKTEDLSTFFAQARKALSTHQKLLEFEPEVPKPETGTVKP